MLNLLWLTALIYMRYYRFITQWNDTHEKITFPWLRYSLLPPPQRIPAIVAAFNDNNVSLVVRGGLQVLVLLADPNAGALVRQWPLGVITENILHDNCMSLVYSQGLGLIANGTAASAADTGALTNHNSHLTAASLSGWHFAPQVLCDSCTLVS